MRRRRVLVLTIAVLVVLGVFLVVRSGSSSTSSPPTTNPARHAVHRPPAATGIPAIEAGVLPWALDQALSREVVLPGTGSSAVVVGGLDASGTSASRIFALDTATGAVTELGHLAAGLHDMAGVQIAGRNFVFGGGSPTTIADVEELASGSGAGAADGTVVGRLPQPRSDASAVRIGATAYVVGGYDGASPDGQVLATTDGEHFSTVATLPVPVRYAAVAAFGPRLYLFGGEGVGGANPGRPVDAVQMVDPRHGTATVVAHLPHPLAGAATAVLGGHLYLAGGATGSGGASAGASESSSATTATGDVYAFDPTHHRLLRAGSLPQAVAYGAAVVVGNRAWLVGGEVAGNPVASVEMLTPNPAFGVSGAPGAGSPYYGGKLLVADRGNNRLLLLDDTGQLVWTYPSTYAAPPPGGFYFPDDAFFAKGGTEIVSNQEQNETIVIIAYPSGQLLWQYGHPHQPGSAPGYLHEPDDAYLLKNGQVTVADAEACRILFINPDKTVANQIGTDNACTHQPPTHVGQPNGDTPLANGDVLVSEINGQWVTEYTPAGKLVWTVQLPISYPSDPQQLGPDLYLISDYATPGAILEFTREGQVVYRYRPTSGLGMLDHPSLTELLPSGVFMTNDDYRDRMVAVDPTTQAVVWQYGIPNQPGTAPGELNTPDGFDLLLPNGTTPTHPATG